MSLLAEEIVEEWLNRQGYFTIRGIKIGVDEIDILAIRPKANGGMECRHMEVTSSVRPVSYISRLPKEVQKSTGRAANTQKRNDKEVAEGVKEWVFNKFKKKKKLKVMEQLYAGEWTSELVINLIKHESELKLIEREGVVIHRLSTILAQLKREKGFVQSASGGDLVDLIQMSHPDES